MIIKTAENFIRTTCKYIHKMVTPNTIMPITKFTVQVLYQNTCAMPYKAVTATINVGGKLLYTLAYQHGPYLSYQKSDTIHNDIAKNLVNIQHQFPGQEVTANVLDSLYGEIAYKVIEDFS